MNNYDYVVLIDENGQPYIAHSWRDKVRSAPAAAKNAGRQAVKYIEKIVDKGKTRYFYTQDELKAFYNNTRDRASNAVNQAKNTARRAAENAGRAIDQATGLGVRKDMKTAEKKAEESQRKAEREQRRAEQAGRIADAARSNAESKWDPLQQAYADQADAAKAVRSAPESISAYDEAIRKQKEADDKVEQRRADNNKAWETSSSQAQRAQDAELRAIRAQNDAKNDRSTADFLSDIYAETPLGRIENAATSAKNAFNSAKDTVSRWGSTTLDSIGDAVNSAKEITASAAKSLQEKWAAGKELTQTEMNQLMSFLMKDYK